MAKFNLNSVYTKDNIYSVLKLLKALIDTLDNYEFQPPIKDRDGNEIPNEWFSKLYSSIRGFYNGNIEVSKDAHIDGNIAIDLDATINGSIKLGTSYMLAYVNYPDISGTIPAIIKYRTENGSIIVDTAIAFDTTNCMLLAWLNLGNVTYANGVYTTTETPAMVDLTAVDANVISNLFRDVTNLKSQINNKQDKLNNTNFSQIFGQYALQPGNIDLPAVNVTFTQDPQDENYYTLTGDKTVSAKTANVKFMSNTLPFTENSHRVFIPDDYDGEVYAGYLADYNLNTKTGDASYIYLCTTAYARNYLQNKLYRHTLNVKSASYFAVFDYYCTSSEPINNLQDLTTYLKPTATSVYPCTCFTNNATPAPANMNAIKYSSNVWKFCLTGGTTETFGDSVLSVSDSVTAVD